MFIPRAFKRTGPVDFQTGQPPVGATQTGPGSARFAKHDVTPWSPVRPTSAPASRRSWSNPFAPADQQRGAPAPFGPDQKTPRRPVAPGSGEPSFVVTPYYDGGAAMFAPQFDTPYVNPVGAGVQVPFRSYPAYYGSGQYDAGVVFWTNKFVPTSIPPSALHSPAVAAAMLADLEVYGAIEVAP